MEDVGDRIDGPIRGREGVVLRRVGVATALIERLVTEARRLDLERLYLWTPSSEAFYARLGWTTIETMRSCGYDIAVMHRSLRP